MIHIEMLEGIESKFVFRIRVRNISKEYCATDLRLTVDIAQPNRLGEALADSSLPDRFKRLGLFYRKWHRVSDWTQDIIGTNRVQQWSAWKSTWDYIDIGDIYSWETCNLAGFIYKNLDSILRLRTEEDERVYVVGSQEPIILERGLTFAHDLIQYEILQDVPLKLRVTAKYRPGFHGARIRKETREFELWAVSAFAHLPDANILDSWTAIRSEGDNYPFVESESGIPIIG